VWVFELVVAGAERSAAGWVIVALLRVVCLERCGDRAALAVVYAFALAVGVGEDGGAEGGLGLAVAVG